MIAKAIDEAVSENRATTPKDMGKSWRRGEG